MKKIILTFATLLVAAGLSFAQDLATATQAAQAANEAWNNKDFTTALKGFQEALTAAEAAGEEGAELVETCKTAIPKVALSIAKEKINAQAYDEGLEALNTAIGLAEKYGADEAAVEAQSLITVVEQAKEKARINGLFNDAEALYQAGDLDAALEAFKVAQENGSTNAAKRIISIYSKKIQSSLQANNVNAAIENLNLLQEADPNNANISAFTNAIASYYVKAKNYSKAKEWFKKLENDPKYGEAAKKTLAALANVK